MPRFRQDLESITPYRPGKPIDEVAREYGLERVIKLASNESPLPPFPEVREAIGREAADLHRYPDNQRYHLRRELAEHLEVGPESLWMGAGTTELLQAVALAIGGPGTSAVYAVPSFVMYPIITRTAGARPVEVPLDGRHRHDLAAMAQAIGADTTVVYVCNPNNPTGTHVSAEDLFAFLEELPDDVLAVIDEAYHEYVRAADYGSALPVALRRENVLVTRTFSKVYGLAGLRVGYAVGHPDTLGILRRVQVPFSVSTLAQVAARTSLRYPERVTERVQQNAEMLKLFSEELDARGIPFVESQTNFVYCRLGADAPSVHQAFLRKGVVIRPMPTGWSRVTVGTEAENRTFFAALDALNRDR